MILAAGSGRLEPKDNFSTDVGFLVVFALIFDVFLLPWVQFRDLLSVGDGFEI